MRVVYIVSVWPEPQTSGASTRVLQVIDCLQKAGFKLLIASAATISSSSADLKSQGLETEFIKLNDSSFDDFIKRQNPDIVIYDRFITEEQYGWRVAENIPNALRVLDTVDLHCLRIARAENVKHPELKLNLQNPTSFREIAAIYRSDISLFVGDYEIELLINNFQVPRQLIYYHPLTYDESSQTKLKSFNDRVNFLAIGSFLHPPNWDQVLKLKTSLWPGIRKQLPNAMLHIVGSYPPAKAFALNNPKQGFIVKGFIENDFAAMQNSRVHLSPLSSGAGIKSKCMLAFRAGTPTVTTEIGAEGLVPSKNWAGKICQNDNEFINSAIKLYKEQDLYIKAQNKCNEILNSFNSEKWDPQLIEILIYTKENLITHRKNNFTGQMMLNHQHLSTRYMSKWIEEKNKK